MYFTMLGYNFISSTQLDSSNKINSFRKLDDGKQPYKNINCTRESDRERRFGGASIAPTLLAPQTQKLILRIRFNLPVELIFCSTIKSL